MGDRRPISTASYWQYREDTICVLEWVEQSAKSYGWKQQPGDHAMPSASTIPTKGSGRLKGKARKAAQEKAAADAAAAAQQAKRDEEERGLEYTAEDILSQANLISSHLTKSPPKGPPPPARVMQALGRAITLRQNFSQWREKSRPRDHENNSAHQDFFKVLEKIECLFLVVFEESGAYSDQLPLENTLSGASRAVKQKFYQSLPWQATQNEYEGSSAQPNPPSGASSTEETTTPSQKSRLQFEDSQENALMVFTLFTDLQKLKAEIKSLWQRCLEDGIDKVVAHILTAQAIAFAKRSEKKILDCLGTPDSPVQEGYHKHSWSFPGTYCQLLNTLRDPTDVQAVLQFEESSHGTEEGGDAMTMSNLTFAFSARRLFSTTKFTLERFVFANSLLQQFADDPFTLLNADIEKVLDRDRDLCRLLLGLVHKGIISSEADDQGWFSAESPGFVYYALSVIHDPIVESLLPLRSRPDVSLTSVFAAEIMLDIKEVCSAFPAFNWSSVMTFNHYGPLLGYKGAVPNVQLTELNVFARVLSIKPSLQKVGEDKLRALVLLPFPVEVSEHAEETSEGGELIGPDEHSKTLYGRLNPLPLKYTKDRYQQAGLFDRVQQPRHDYVDKYYPTYILHRAAHLRALMETISLTITNLNWHMVGAMAHVYNASRHLGIGNLRWPAMDRMMDGHKTALFVGDPPTTPIAMFRSYIRRHEGPDGEARDMARDKDLFQDETRMIVSEATAALNLHWQSSGHIPFWWSLESWVLAGKAGKKIRVTDEGTPVTAPDFVESMPAMEEYLKEQVQDMCRYLDYLEIDSVSIAFKAALGKHAREIFEQQPHRTLEENLEDKWASLDFLLAAFDQEAHLVGPKAKCGGDLSKLPLQDCDYLLDGINCLASVLGANGIGICPDRGTSAAEDAVNMPVSSPRYRIRGPNDDDPRHEVFFYNCIVCDRKHCIYN